jgi:Co/Zn/Cd efflux system component
MLYERNYNSSPSHHGIHIDNSRAYEPDDDDRDFTKKGFGHIFRSIWNDSDCKRLFLFTLLSAGVTLIEILYGAWASSLG